MPDEIIEPPALERVVIIEIDCPHGIVPRYEHHFLGVSTRLPEPTPAGWETWQYEARLTCPETIWHPPEVRVMPESVLPGLAFGLVLVALLRRFRA